MTHPGTRRRPAARTCGALAVTSLMVPAGGCAAGGQASAPGPQGSSRSAGVAVTTPAPGQTKALAGRYMAIAVSVNHRLDHEVDGFADHERDDLAAAEADLRAEATTERWFDRHLAAIPFPAAIAPMVRAMILANQSRATLTDQQARAASLTELRSFAGPRRAVDAAVEFGVRVIRRALGLPPPDTS